RAYALCIIAGIILAVWLTMRRFRERGGDPEHVWDVAAWAVVLGIIGGRLYHVISDPELYFKPGRHPLDALKIWDGGLGIWGAIALGAAGAWIGCRRRKIKLAVFADAAAPGVIFAQAIGRWGNWFNNELYGGHTSLPWKLQIHCLDIDVGHATGCTDPGTSTVLGYFQPTFLYEALWDVGVGVALLLLDRRFRLGRGNVMALYVMGYTAGRVWIEALRSDHANHFLGLRLNDWTSVIVFVGGLVWFLRHGGFHAAREDTPYYDTHDDTQDDTPAAPDQDESEEIQADG
ncbi:MAG TPA: prolipoprotein diacylglyceryl transferase, partial [Jatrophihabitans sp.]|nr:prolipoprotein diacylglyceryl transferase [Jatrophihabitans sp.]